MNILARQIISGQKSPKVQGLNCRVIASPARRGVVEAAHFRGCALRGTLSRLLGGE